MNLYKVTIKYENIYVIADTFDKAKDKAVGFYKDNYDPNHTTVTNIEVIAKEKEELRKPQIGGLPILVI